MESGVLLRSVPSQPPSPFQAVTLTTHGFFLQQRPGVEFSVGSSVLLQAEPFLMNLLFRFHFQDTVLRGDMVHFPVLTPPPPVFSATLLFS